MRLDQAGHQRGAAAVDGGDAAGRQRARAPGDARDAVALHQHLAGVRRGAGGVEDPHVREEHVGHAPLLGLPPQLRRAATGCAE